MFRKRPLNISSAWVDEIMDCIPRVVQHPQKDFLQLPPGLYIRLLSIVQLLPSTDAAVPLSVLPHSRHSIH